MKLPTEEGNVAGEPIELGPDLIATILRVIEEGWARANAMGATATDLERPLTERLRCGMRTAKCRPESVVVQRGTESLSSQAALVPDGLTDIPLFLLEVYFKSSVQDPHAIIECKRIAGTDTDLCREYVVNGIDRFRDGKYSSRHRAAFMVGYVLVGTIDDAAKGIDKYLAGRRRVAEGLVPSTVVAGPWLRESRHQRLAHGLIVLHHAFLSFGSDS